MTVVAIHQPTFLPWLGWWNKLVRADVFVLLDDVQFSKKGGTWMNRVGMLVNGRPAWVSVPVDRSYHGLRSVRETVTDDKAPWREKIAKTIATSYGRTRHFDDVYPRIEELLQLPSDRLAELNETSIRRIATWLELDTSKLVRQSDLGVTGTGTDLLVELCRATGSDTYLTGDGAGGYLEADRFQSAGIALVLQEFVPPRYPQLADGHVPGLSVVDALMSCGWEGTAELVVGPPC
jgi:WbqC-like protein family